MPVYIHKDRLIFVEVAQKLRQPVALPKNGHILDIQGTVAHDTAARSFVPNIEKLLPTHQKDIVNAIGFIGYISKVNEDDGTFWLSCACGATFIANINDYTGLRTPPPTEKINPLKLK